MRRILRIGLPGGMDVLSLVWLQLVFLSIVNSLSTDELAAHGVAIRIESIAYLPGYAFQVAAATLAGQYLGARDSAAHAQRLGGLRGQWHAVCGVGLVLFFGARPLVGLFLSPAQTGVAAIAPTLLRIVAVAMPPLALMQVFTGALRGAARRGGRWCSRSLAFWACGCRWPTCWFSSGNGALTALVCHGGRRLFRCLLVVFRFRHGGWQRIEV